MPRGVSAVDEARLQRRLWTPTIIAPALWFDAADAATITTVSGAVSQWNDKSGNARHYVQNTSANRPTYESAVQNNLNAVRIANTGTTRQFVDNTSFSFSGTQISLFSVHRNSANPTLGTPNVYGRLFSFAASAQNDYDNTNGLILVYGVSSGISLYRNNATIASTSAINDQWLLVSAERNGTAGRISLNGGTFTTGTTSSASQGITRSRIGNDFVAADSGMLGWIGEQVVVFGALSDADWERLQGYAAHRWGLTASLPAGHPYRNRPPLIGD